MVVCVYISLLSSLVPMPGLKLPKFQMMWAISWKNQLSILLHNTERTHKVQGAHPKLDIPAVWDQ